MGKKRRRKREEEGICNINSIYCGVNIYDVGAGQTSLHIEEMKWLPGKERDDKKARDRKRTVGTTLEINERKSRKKELRRREDKTKRERGEERAGKRWQGRK